jgi:tRNA A-37 threonylcarbamoyl transferase component Bud32
MQGTAMASLEINPRYRAFLERHGLVAAEQYLALPGPIFCGHPDRNVARTLIGTGPDALSAFLKREHAVLWRTRLANAWAGFGFVSRSIREARLLQALHRAGVTAPEWLAAGEDDHGRAFLLVRDLENMRELRPYLRSADSSERRRLARVLGAALAHLHEAGFRQPDLYAKHLLVAADGSRVAIVDWQRGQRCDFVDWPQRYRDLAALHASLADDLAAPRDRLACLRAYLRVAAPCRLPRRFRANAIRTIRHGAERLARHRHVRELRQTPGDTELPSVICLDGEALCVTPQAQAVWGEVAPAWLTTSGRSIERGRRVDRAVVQVPGASEATLVRRRTDWPLSWVCSWLWGNKPTAQEIRQAGLIFRLQRYRIETPRLLAFGQRHHPPWRTESFLLTESPTGGVNLADWLTADGVGLRQRRHLLQEAGQMLRCLHEVGCRVFPTAGRPRRSCPLVVRVGPNAVPALALGTIEGIVPHRKRSARAERCDLAMLLDQAAPASQTDRLRLLLGYLGLRQLDSSRRRWGRLIVDGRASVLVGAPTRQPAREIPLAVRRDGR